MKAVSMRNDEPERPRALLIVTEMVSVVSEGAGIVVVEELEHAKARGAKIYCELTDTVFLLDAYHITLRPGWRRCCAAMQLA